MDFNGIIKGVLNYFRTVPSGRRVGQNEVESVVFEHTPISEISYDIATEEYLVANQSAISSILLNEFSKWELVELPPEMFHGCQSTDLGVDIESRSLSGNKWFSTDVEYAGGYAWFHTRPEKPAPGSRYCAKLELLSNSFKAIKRPSDFKAFPDFLSKCFPDVPSDYSLSRHFQTVLKEHLDALYDVDSHVIGYYFPEFRGSEILIPECEKYLRVIEFVKLADERYSDS